MPVKLSDVRRSISRSRWMPVGLRGKRLFQRAHAGFRGREPRSARTDGDSDVWPSSCCWSRADHRQKRLTMDEPTNPLDPNTPTARRSSRTLPARRSRPCARRTRPRTSHRNRRVDRRSCPSRPAPTRRPQRPSDAMPCGVPLGPVASARCTSATTPNSIGRWPSRCCARGRPRCSVRGTRRSRRRASSRSCATPASSRSTTSACTTGRCMSFRTTWMAPISVGGCETTARRGRRRHGSSPLWPMR